MNFQEWLSRNRTQILQLVRQGGTLDQIMQGYDPTTGSFTDPFSGQQVSASQEDLANWQRVIARGGMGQGAESPGYYGSGGDDPRHRPGFQNDPGTNDPTEDYGGGTGQMAGAPNPATAPPGPGGGPPSPTYNGPDPGSYNVNDILDNPQFQELLGMMQQMGLLDMEQSRWMFDRAKREYAEGRPMERYLLDLLGGDVLGANFPEGGGAYSRRQNAFDPNNPRSWSLLAAPASQVAGDLDAQMKQLQDLGLSGDAIDKAKADAINRSYANVAGLRSGLTNEALGFIKENSNQKKFGVPMAPQSGAANSLLGFWGNKYGTDVNAATSRYGTDVGAATSRYGTDVGAQTSRYGTDKQYDLGLRNIALQRQLGRGNLLGNLFNTLGGLGASFFGASDIRLKEDIKRHSPGLKELKKLKVYDWKYNGKGDTRKGEERSGVMAQDLLKLIPEAVEEFDSKDGKFLAVDYFDLLATTINAVKELDKKVSRKAA